MSRLTEIVSIFNLSNIIFTITCSSDALHIHQIEPLGFWMHCVSSWSIYLVHETTPVFFIGFLYSSFNWNGTQSSSIPIGTVNFAVNPLKFLGSFSVMVYKSSLTDGLGWLLQSPHSNFGRKNVFCFFLFLVSNAKFIFPRVSALFAVQLSSIKGKN